MNKYSIVDRKTYENTIENLPNEFLFIDHEAKRTIKQWIDRDHNLIAQAIYYVCKRKPTFFILNNKR